MMTQMLRVLLVALALALPARGARGQAVETPIPFDSAGRVMAITPLAAARLELGPPAWRVTGDYVHAQLFALGNQGFVVVVRRRDGAVERYSITREDREYLRARTGTLPPGFDQRLGRVGDQIGQQAQAVARHARNDAFVRNQALLGLGVYAPSFARAVTGDRPGQIAAYLLAAGATFFGASQFARDYPVSSTQNRLATHLAVRGGGMGYGLAYALDASGSGHALGVFVGSLAGTSAGILLGRTLTDSLATAGVFGGDALALATGGVLLALTERDSADRRPTFPSQSQTLALIGAHVVGTALGTAYVRAAEYAVTPGDVNALWVTGGIGALAAGAVTEATDAPEKATFIALSSGFVAGVLAGDILLARRFDHTRLDAGLLALGGVAGGLMGAGVYVLADRERGNDAVPFALAAAGAAAGVTVTANYLLPRAAGRTGARATFHPAGLAMSAGRVRGTHPILSVTF